MSEKIATAGVVREQGFLYFITNDGHIARTKCVGQIKGKRVPEIVKRVGFGKEKGYLYFLDKQGDVSRAKMERHGGKRTLPQAAEATMGLDLPEL